MVSEQRRHLIAPGGATSVGGGWPGGSGVPALIEPEMWHFKHDEKWKAPVPFHAGLLGFGLFGSEPSWHWTHTGIGGMRICRSVEASCRFMWHCWHCIDAPVRGSS